MQNAWRWIEPVAAKVVQALPSPTPPLTPPSARPLHPARALRFFTKNSPAWGPYNVMDSVPADCGGCGRGKGARAGGRSGAWEEGGVGCRSFFRAQIIQFNKLSLMVQWGQGC